MHKSGEAAAMAPARDRELRYRPEIDGLRAIAILPILLLHCGISVVRGGYIGVDVFFVISGYLITDIITREMAEQRFSLLEFYRRRAVRILPALGVMIGVTLALGCWLLLPVSLQDLGRSAAWTSVFGSNIYFYLTSDYFSQRADLQPLIHTWSLAVEEQFYLFYPLLLLALRKLDHNRLTLVLVLIAALSFAVGGWYSANDQIGGYFLLPGRIWELMLGGLIALGAYPQIASDRLRTILCAFALAGIILFAIGTSLFWPFPVPSALPPVAAAAFLLAYMPGTRVAWLLERGVFRAVGRISYSLYLWHRPIIAFYLLDRPGVLTLRDSVILLLASFIAAMASYWCVERPALRRWRGGAGGVQKSGASIPASLGISIAGIVVFAVASLLVSMAAWNIRSLPADVARVARFEGFDSTPAGLAQFSTHSCFTVPRGREYDPACMVPSETQPNILLVGDSHAAQLSQALRQSIPSSHLIQATAAGCRPLLHGTGVPACRHVVEQAFNSLNYHRIHSVILAGRWFSADIQALVETIHFLRSKGTKVIIIGPVVEYDTDVPDALARAMLADNVSRMEAFRIKDRGPLDRYMAPIIRRAGGVYVSWFELECPASRCRRFTKGGDPLHIDRTHVSPEWASIMVAQIKRIAREP